MFDWFLLSILTALIWGILPFFEKQAMAHISDSFAAVFMRTIGASMGLLIPIFSAPTRASLPGTPFKAYAFLFISGFLGSVIGQITYLTAIKHGEVSRVTPVAAAWPIIAFIMAVILLGEPITVKKTVAILVVVSGIILLKA
ncbi:MAG: EamA family transporter [Candidatus Obscuribacterales bacterium]|nr:EamA family transporter [Candidatus Obscuribacterales bacterium]